MSNLLRTVEVPLKPCPLCGGEAVMESVTTAMERVSRYRVRCTVCGVGCLHWDMWSVAESANWWNRRDEKQPL